jgi:hypothetical protein
MACFFCLLQECVFSLSELNNLMSPVQLLNSSSIVINDLLLTPACEPCLGESSSRDDDYSKCFFLAIQAVMTIMPCPSFPLCISFT